MVSVESKLPKGRKDKIKYLFNKSEALLMGFFLHEINFKIKLKKIIKNTNQKSWHFFHFGFISLEQSQQFTNPEKHLVRLDIMVTASHVILEVVKSRYYNQKLS